MTEERIPSEVPGEFFVGARGKTATRPVNVNKAVNRIIWGFAINVLTVIITLISFDYNTNALIVMIVFIAFAGLITFFLIYQIREGKGWARLVYLIFSLLGLALEPFQIEKVITGYPLIGVLDIVDCILTILSIILLYKKDSNVWFKLES